jgi:hypothetical protein
VSGVSVCISHLVLCEDADLGSPADIWSTCLPTGLLRRVERIRPPTRSSTSTVSVSCQAINKLAAQDGTDLTSCPALEGFGFLQNHFVITSLVRDYASHPILIPIQPHISMTLVSTLCQHPCPTVMLIGLASLCPFKPSRRHLFPFTRAETIDSFSRAVEHYGFYDPSQAGPDRGGVAVFSHSNGSVSHAWVLKDLPGAVRKSCFVDPVVFCLWEGGKSGSSPRCLIARLTEPFSLLRRRLLQLCLCVLPRRHLAEPMSRRLSG